MRKNNYSVLMSVYNKESPEYLRMSIESMLKQTFITNDFVIMCDGPLTNELDSVLDEYEKKYEIINVYRMSENMGLGIALNEGIKKCKNNLVARMDSDDISVSNRCEIQYAVMAKDESLAICGGNIIEFGKDLNDLREKRIVPNTYGNIKKYSKYRNPFNHMTVMYRKNIIEAVGGYMDMPSTEDYYLWLRLLKQEYNCCNLNEILVYARVGNNMIARRGGFDYIKKISHFRFTQYKMGSNNIIEFLIVLFINVIVCIIPGGLRYKFYMMFLRKK